MWEGKNFQKSKFQYSFTFLKNMEDRENHRIDSCTTVKNKMLSYLIKMMKKISHVTQYNVNETRKHIICSTQTI